MNYLKWKILTSLSVIVLFMWGCTSTAKIEKDPSADFTSYRSFAWINKEKKDRQSDLLERQLQSAVASEMQKLGFRENRNKPDILLDYDIQMERSSRSQSDPVYSQSQFRQVFNPSTRRWGTVYFPSQYMGTETYQVPVNERTITITMIDARNDKTIWQGWSTNSADSKNLTSKEINSSVKAIIKKLK